MDGCLLRLRFQCATSYSQGPMTRSSARVPTKNGCLPRFHAGHRRLHWKREGCGTRAQPGCERTPCPGVTFKDSAVLHASYSSQSTTGCTVSKTCSRRQSGRKEECRLQSRSPAGPTMWCASISHHAVDRIGDASVRPLEDSSTWRITPRPMLLR